MRRALLIITLLYAFFSLEAQEPTYRQYVKAGDLFFEKYKDYHNAGEFYKKAYEFPSADKVHLSFRIAECAFHSWKLEEAKYNYTRFLIIAPDTLKIKIHKAKIRLGVVLQRLAEYDEAIVHLEDYQKEIIEEDPDGDIIIINQLIAVNRWALTQKDRLDIDINALEEINDSAKHELAIVPIGDNIIYTSFAFPEKRNADFEHQVGNILQKSVSSSVIESRFDLSLDPADSSIAFMTFNTDSTSVYYALCDHKNTLEMNCRIYKSDLSGYNRSIVLYVDSEHVTHTHPHILQGDEPGQEILMFVSDRPGGIGGLDIWYNYLDEFGKAIGEPINLASVNSEADEQSPFYHADSQTLYFSSNCIDHEQSFGGADIYQALREPTSPFSFDTKEILSRPYNSSKNDLFFVRSETQSWLSSNRTDPRNEEPTKDACCYDLFSVEDTPHPILLKPDSLYFRPIVHYYCPGEKKDSILDIRQNNFFLIAMSDTVGITSDTIKIQKEKAYELLVKFCGGQQIFSVNNDSANNGLIVDHYYLDVPPYYKPAIFNYCYSLEKIPIDSLDNIFMIQLGDTNSSGERKPINNKKLITDACKLFPVEQGKHYWLIVEKEGFYKDTLDVEVAVDQCGAFSCEFYIKPTEVELNVMVQCPCDEFICYMSAEHFSVTVPGSKKILQNRAPSMESHSFKVTPWQTYKVTASINETGEQLTPINLQIQSKRNDCTLFQFFEYYKLP